MQMLTGDFPIQKQIHQAALAYQMLHGTEPNICYIHESVYQGLITELERGVWKPIPEDLGVAEFEGLRLYRFINGEPHIMVCRRA